MVTVTLRSDKASNLIIYLIKYFFFIFIVLLLLDLMRIFPAIIYSAALRYLLIGVIMFTLFLLVEVISPSNKKQKVLPIRVIIESLLDVTFIVPIIQILRNKRVPTKSMSPNSIFLLGIGYFFIIFLTSLVFYEVIFRIPHLLTAIVGTGQFTTTNISQYQYPAFIIIHNSVFIAEIMLGSFFFLLPTFGAILLDSLVTTPILLYLINVGHSNAILPQLLLELIGTGLATGSAFLIFYTFFTSLFTRVRTYDYMRMMVYSKKIIIVGIALSIYVFLLGWPIESELLLSKINAGIWYNSVYLFDVVTIIVYAAFLYDLLVRRIFPLQKVILPSLWAGTFLFIVLAGDGKYEAGLIFEVVLLSTVSLIYPTFGFVRSFMRRKNEKEMTDLFLGTSCFISRAMGNSMYPGISSKDYVITCKTDDEFTFKNGDVVTYEPILAFSPFFDSRYVTHRIVKIEEEKIITKGDNLKGEDPPIKQFRIHGLAIATYNPELGIFSALTDREEMEGITTRVKQIAIQEGNPISKVKISRRILLSYTVVLPLVISVTLPVFFLFLL